jgi:hypothetical protein
MNSHRAVAPKSMFISSHPIGRPSLILCYPGGATIARRLHNGGVITMDVFASPIPPVQIKVPQNTNDDPLSASMVPLAAPSSGVPSVVASPFIAPVVHDELQPGAPPTVTATVVPLVVATPTPAVPPPRIVDAPLPIAATMPSATSVTTAVTAKKASVATVSSSSSSSPTAADTPLPLVPVGKKATEYKVEASGSRAKAKESKQSEAINHQINSEDKKMVADVIVADQSSVLAVGQRAPSVAAPAPKQATNAPEKKTDRISKARKRIEKKGSGVARTARIEAAKQIKLTGEQIAERDRQKALTLQRMVPTQFSQCHGVLVRTINHQVQVMDLTHGRASKAWSPGNEFHDILLYAHVSNHCWVGP